MRHHRYGIKVEWTGDQGEGTSDYVSYQRSHTISASAKYGEILASADPSFRGERSKYNPEELFLGSISACHMLWYLHLCSEYEIVVKEYTDNATGLMITANDGGGRFTNVVLNPLVTIEDEGKITLANSIHKQANRMCFIANSCNIMIEHCPVTTVAKTT